MLKYCVLLVRKQTINDEAKLILPDCLIYYLSTIAETYLVLQFVYTRLDLLEEDVPTLRLV